MTVEVIEHVSVYPGAKARRRIDRCIALSAECFGVQVSEIFCHSRERRLIKARHVSMWLVRNVTDKSLPSIGALFRGRDHTSILHALRNVARLREEDPEFKSITDDLLAQCCAIGAPVPSQEATHG